MSHLALASSQHTPCANQAVQHESHQRSLQAPTQSPAHQIVVFLTFLNPHSTCPLRRGAIINPQSSLQSEQHPRRSFKAVLNPSKEEYGFTTINNPVVIR